MHAWSSTTSPAARTRHRRPSVLSKGCEYSGMALDAEDLLKIILVLVLIWIVLELLGKIIGAISGLFGGVLGLLIALLIVLFLLDRI